jgi:5-methylcytosine-specific restriction endonuclease McrA
LSPNRAARREKYSALATYFREEGFQLETNGHPTPRRRQSGNDGIQSGFRTSLDLATKRNRLTREDRKWRQDVLHLGNYVCAFCGATRELETDHIKPVHLYPDLRFNVDNGRVLCHSCHIKTPTYGSKVHKIVNVEIIP